MPKDLYSIVETYFSDPDGHWDGIGWRQAEKLKKMVKSAADAGGITKTEVFGEVMAASRHRRENRPPPLYLVNIGGSGSHWLGLMLGELDGLVDGAEIYFPPAVLSAIRPLPAVDQAVVVDAIHLLHGWGRSRDWAKTKRSTIVNSAHKPEFIGMYRAWDPNCAVVHLVREPRDRVLSVTYRKTKFRSQHAPGVDDETYLRRNAARTDSYLRRYLSSGNLADMSVKYEDIKADPKATVQAIARLASKGPSSAAIERAVFLHDAMNIRSGVTKSSGNLDEGGVAGHWSEARRRDRLIMHHALAFADDALGYPGDDCSAQDETHAGATKERRISAREDCSYHASLAGPWMMAGSVVPPGASLRVRPHDTADIREVIDHIHDCEPDVLCLAGRKTLRDDDLALFGSANTIKGFDLAGTGVSSAAASILQGFPHLEWVAATDTALEAWARERYPRAN